MEYEMWTSYICFLIMYHHSLPILESQEYDPLSLPSLICTASSFLMHKLQIGQPMYIFFLNILKKNQEKNLPSFSFKFKVCSALFVSVALQMCMLNELLNQHRPSIKSVTRAVPREWSCRPDVHHTLSPKPTPRRRHWLLFHTGALPSL